MDPLLLLLGDLHVDRRVLHAADGPRDPKTATTEGASDGNDNLAPVQRTPRSRETPAEGCSGLLALALLRQLPGGSGPAVLAITGPIYLFRFQLEPLMHADLMKVEQPADSIGSPTPPARRRRELLPGRHVVSMTEPAAGDATVFSVTHAGRVDPRRLRQPVRRGVLGSLNPDTTLSGDAVRLHGELMAGPLGDYVIELGPAGRS